MGEHMDKGCHEKAMEKAKDLLNKGIGMGEIKEITGLDEHNINKARKKMEGKI
ncbi:hypothetical protein KM792_12250 [Clostridium tyrobutyricum]|jgi:transposase-like protein|uniref:Transposase n=1 Tax=Clostridium tyrobutyricum DIVETGP TaxID=1408889 RepID=W6NJS6_CLOTY|nr:hypothetical protein [Clostridium tyrobutyricum]AND83762.1 hypothetical protein CTK_C04920 [Clostridium tyrobutyricum]MBV4417277.1 hypothetical protein [Clostridium tyrobutyricum]MBV4423263.1 hypothetical protein [Clostridium tyrobutyricum]MBV4426559.1 hypothetical protein [Clostridium tyrobutyricum]MBV4432563.1 hypothetical protein [Clostridium tyrobutyricum]